MAIKKVNLDSVDDVIFISDIHFGAKSASTEWSGNMIGYIENFFFPLAKQEFADGFNPVIVNVPDRYDEGYDEGYDCQLSPCPCCPAEVETYL